MVINALSFDFLKGKAQREIANLVASQRAMEVTVSIDNALNAAFTIYHLIQWKNPGIKVHKYMETCANKGLKMLHNVVTRQKHISVNETFGINDSDPKVDDNIVELCAANGSSLLTCDGRRLVTASSFICVYFGDIVAIDVLRKALQEFS